MTNPLPNPAQPANRPLESPPTVWVTGAAGLIGSQLVATAKTFAPEFNVIGLTRAEVDLTDFERVGQLFRKHKPAMIIHCAAMSRNPDCQANPALARKVNTETTAHLAELATEVGFIFFSTDLVFDGQKGNYVESDRVNPLGVYAETKAAAEEIVQKNPRHCIIRTSLNGGLTRTQTAFNEEMRKAWQAGKAIKLFTDEFRCPMAAVVTARAVWELARGRRAGVCHLSGSERLSRLQIGQLLAARHPKLAPRIEASSLREYQGAPRAPDCSLNLTKIQKLLSFPLPGLTAWLQENQQADF